MSVSLRSLFVLVLITLPLLACEQESSPPDGVLNESLYLDLTTELYLTMQWVQLREIYEQEDSLRQLVFDHYGVSPEQFQKSHQYYQSDIDGQLIRLDSLRVRFDREERRLNEHRTGS
ncbi:MAG: DUF4296 domain-containing protein [Balneolaceae bacterium]